MSAVATRLPGWGGTTIADASDDELQRNLAADLEAIAAILAGYNTEPTDEGFAPAAWHERVSKVPADHHDQSAVARYERRIRAIREELPRREEQRRAEARARLEDARQRLTVALAAAPQAAESLLAHSVEVIAATERVRAFIRDLRLMGGSTRLSAAFDALHRGTQAAAQALDEEAPELPPAPEGLPTVDEVGQVMSSLTAGRGFDEVPSDVPGDLRRADALAKLLMR